jgi:molybdenum cofactor biosynthesis protein B
MRTDAEHKQSAPLSVRCFIVTVSDTRTDETDTSGRAIADLLQGAGHQVTGRIIVKDEPAIVRNAVERQLASTDVDVIISTGGTGIAARDTTFEAVDSLRKAPPGFGELFRMLSYEQIGSAAIDEPRNRRHHRRHIVVALPGSESAVRLAMEKLLLPELGHLVQQARKWRSTM